jgi:NTP pyrophosphatase (non-canonical NTP hydrolase)
MSYLTNGLSFNTLRDANKERIKSSRYEKCEREWTTAHWMQATVGELGELANLMKKVDRGDIPLSIARPDIARELADVQTYLDIMAFKLGVDLGEATRKKFNEVSERMGSRIYIGDDDDWHLTPDPATVV